MSKIKIFSMLLIAISLLFSIATILKVEEIEQICIYTQCFIFEKINYHTFSSIRYLAIIYIVYSLYVLNLLFKETDKKIIITKSIILAILLMIFLPIYFYGLEYIYNELLKQLK